MLYVRLLILAELFGRYPQFGFDSTCCLQLKYWVNCIHNTQSLPEILILNTLLCKIIFLLPKYVFVFPFIKKTCHTGRRAAGIDYSVHSENNHQFVIITLIAVRGQATMVKHPVKVLTLLDV